MFRRGIVARFCVYLASLVCLCCAFFAAIQLRFVSGFWRIQDAPDTGAYGVLLLTAALAWSATFRYFRLDQVFLAGRPYSEWLAACAKAVLMAALIVAGAAFYYREYSFSRIAMALFWMFQAALVSACGVLAPGCKRTLGQPAAVAVIGSRRLAGALLNGDELVTCVRPDDEMEIRRLRIAPACREILVALEAAEIHALPRVLECLSAAPVPVKLVFQSAAPVPVKLVFQSSEARVENKNGVLLVDIGLAPANTFRYRVVKRALDLGIAAGALVLGAPVALLVAGAIRLTSGAPVLFRQQRVGAGGREFTLYKFRTLPVAAAEVSDRHWSATVPPEARPLGRWLRRLALDEWPQFWNVVRGDMSVVGPRPERPHFAEGFSDALAGYSLRQRLQAGITGWAQVHGFAGDSDVSRRLEYDLDYLRRWSLMLDLKILAMTPLHMLGRGASAVAPQRSAVEDPTQEGAHGGRERHAHSV